MFKSSTYLIRIGRVASRACQLAGMTAILIIVTDLMAALLLHVPRHVHALGLASAQLQADHGARWAVELHHEESQLSERWYPYVYWRSSPYQGQYIHVGTNGLRATVESAPATGGNRSKAFKIFMFGGSTMFGLGARDDYTIPSLLGQMLQRDGARNVQITNFGQVGYVSTQEVIELSEQLRRGNIPDLVVFYDGINDAAASYQNGVAGVPQNEFNRVREFNLLNQADPAKRRALYAAAAIAFLNHTALGELARAVATRYAQPLLYRVQYFLPYNQMKSGMGIRRNWDVGNQSEELAKETVDSYLENMRLVEAEGKRFRFSSLFYWQPVLYSKPHQSELEKKIEQASDRSAPGMKKFMRETYFLAREASERTQSPRVDDISRIFADVRKTCFVDLFHITGHCNAIVAARMEKDVRLLIERDQLRKTALHRIHHSTSNRNLRARSLSKPAIAAVPRVNG